MISFLISPFRQINHARRHATTLSRPSAAVASSGSPAGIRFAHLGLLAAMLSLVLAGNAAAAQLTLKWSDNSTNETGFKIERATGTTGAFVQIATTGANVTSYLDQGLVSSTVYRYRVCAFNLAGNSGYSNTATTTTPAPVNTAPTVSTVANQTINEDGSTGALSLTIGDAETPASSLSISGSSSNTTLIPGANISFGGSGTGRSVTVRPAANQSGSATITISVSDGSLTTSRAFTVTVLAVNDAPTISSIASRSLQAGASSGPIAVAVGDIETPAGSLIVTASSSNQSLLPNSALALSGSGANRTLTFTPPSSTGGSATVTVQVSDGSLTASTSFTVTISAANTAPTITSIANRTVQAGESSGSIAFTVGDAQTAAGSLTVTASSSNQTQLPTGALVLGGSGANRTLTFTSPSSSNGSATVTVRVSDGALSATSSFVVNVTPTNTAPTISTIPGQNITMNGTTGALAFTIGDAQTPAASLTLITNASNKALIPLENIVLAGSGANRTVTIRPAFNSTGWSTIWIKVSDGLLTQTISFVVNVSSVLTYEDIGAPAIAGSHTTTGSKIELVASGADIWGASDQFRFAHQPIEGDSELTVRVSSLTKSHEWAKAGLMYRSSTAADAAYVFVLVSPSHGVSLQYRSLTGGRAAQKYVEAATMPRWLKLTRTGDTFYAFHSADGLTWDLVDFVTVDLPDTAPAGLAATSHTATATTTATFEYLSVD